MIITKQQKDFCKSLLLLVFLSVPFLSVAQSTKSLRINEVLVINKNNFVDQYGQRSPWIEIYNNSARTVNIGGCFLTDDPNLPTKYPIPRGDVKTKISPYQHILFWADGMPIRGTFHLNFKLKPGEKNYIALYDSDGKSLLDNVTVPANQVEDVSYGRVIDGKDEWVTLEKVTPDTNNKTIDKNIKVERLKRDDKDGLAITLISMSVVFTALIIAFLFIKGMGIAFTTTKGTGKTVVKDMSDANVKPIPQKADTDDAVYVAIGLALYEAFNSGYEQEGELTITPIKKTYSPWSSKIQMMRQNPRG